MLKSEDQIRKNFWCRVQKGGAEECWLWLGPKRNMYGVAWYRGKGCGAHRLAWQFTHGEIPALAAADSRGACILHRCDTPACVNPAHLFLGSHRDNMADKNAKDRNAWKNKPLCKKGHQRTSDNLYVARGGGRSCRACHRERQTKYNKLRKSSALRSGGRPVC